jgi:cyclopropane fatty-acyl-phospholipid synthase-like methyltransferase
MSGARRISTRPNFDESLSCESSPVNPLHHERYVRSNNYDPEWIFRNQMGPNALWLMESLTEVLPVTPGMRVLDLGCGRAMTSIFLAREFGAEVWATDLWIEASANQVRIREAGVEKLVVPIHAEAHGLPFAEDFFDAIVSVDAYQYFGTADLYLGYILGFLHAGGRIGIVTPALRNEMGSTVPGELAPFWEWDFCCFHSPEWWRAHWQKTGKVTVDHADAVEDGWKDWLRFDEASLATLDGWRLEAAANSIAMHAADKGKNLGFSRVVATKLADERSPASHPR